MNIKVGALAVAAAAFLSAPVQADWDPADGWKWLQNPDLRIDPQVGPLGIDIAVGNSSGFQRTVADDFLCTQTGPIQDIHLWMSFVNDTVISDPATLLFQFGIWTDVPAGSGLVPWSTPGGQVWSAMMNPTSYRVVATLPGEPYWDPISTYPSGSDSLVWQFNFDPIDNPYIQEGTPTDPIVYWLSVGVVGYQDPGQFIYDDHIGWKTSAEHWNDDAVFWDDRTAQWTELVYQLPHPLAGQSIDMAFVITTPEPATYGLIAGLGLLGFAVLRRRLS
jgi:hypothetical protein